MVGGDVNTGNIAPAEEGDSGADQIQHMATAVRHVFASGVTIGPGASLVVTGGPSSLPNSQAASTGAISLANAGDDVVLRDPAGVTVQSISYNGSLASRDGVSMTREMDGEPESLLVLHDELSGLPSSPNRRNDGTDF